MRAPMLLVIALAACTGTTGGDVVDFPAAAAGPADAEAIKANGFDSDFGWHVVLTKASLHVGALYLSQSQPVSGAQATSCVLPGTYVAQVTTGLDVDLLSSSPKLFPTPGHGTTLRALAGQVWLAGDGDHDVDDTADTTPILVIEGTATRGGDVRPFAGTITIASNRIAQGGPVAGANTLCKQRIVSPIPTNVTLAHEGGLLLRIDPRRLFVNVDFGKLTSGFTDDDASQPSVNLYQNLHAAGAIAPLYTFAWDETLR